MGNNAANTRRDEAVEATPSYEEILEGVSLLFRPLLSERWERPVRLNKDADKGGEVVYAIGRGPAGLVIELHNAYGVSPPTTLGSLANHRPSVFDHLDPQILASLTADDPLA